MCLVDSTAAASFGLIFCFVNPPKVYVRNGHFLRMREVEYKPDNAAKRDETSRDLSGLFSFCGR